MGEYLGENELAELLARKNVFNVSKIFRGNF